MIWTALLFGLLGSLHCAGMCGAIALSIPMDLRTRLAASRDALLYNVGRVFTYSLMGLAIGLLSQPLAIFGYQRWLSLATGTGILAAYFIFGRSGKESAGGAFFSRHIKPRFAALLNSPSKSNLVVLGMLNGLLPCGFVYMALAAASASGSWQDSAAYMALFGLGTLPMMTAIPLSRKLAGIKFRLLAQKARPYFVVLVAGLLIVRGLNLGIPYLSPQQDLDNPKQAVKCH